MKDATLRRFCKIVAAFPLIVLCSASAAQNYPPSRSASSSASRRAARTTSSRGVAPKLGEHWAPGHRRQPRRREHRDRFGRVRAHAARRLHDHAERARTRDQPGADEASISIRSRTSLHHDRRGIPESARRASVVSAEHVKDSSRFRRTSGRHQLRLVGDRHHRASFGGALSVHDRRQMGAHPVQRRRAGPGRPPERRVLALLRQRADGHPAGARREAAGVATTGAKRTPARRTFPLAESGIPGYEVTTFYGISAPAKTPRPIIDRFHSEIVKVLNAPDIRQKLSTSAPTPSATRRSSTPHLCRPRSRSGPKSSRPQASRASSASRGGAGAPSIGDAPRPRSPERWCGTGRGAAASHMLPLAGAARCSRTLLRTPSRSGTPVARSGRHENARISNGQERPVVTRDS